MKQLDKVTLLFEMLLGVDQNNVNRKIEQIRVSNEYDRVSRFVEEYSETSIGSDIAKRFKACDIFGILSMQRALEVEQEIIELDRRISNLPTLNPYLAKGVEKQYKVNTVGQIGVEISAKGMPLNEFTTNEGVSPSNRTKVLKSKLFNWFREAKNALNETIENSKMLLVRVRHSKIAIGSINLQHGLLVIGLVFFVLVALFNGKLDSYVAGTAENPLYPVISTCAFYLGVVCTIISTIIVTAIDNYPFYVASGLRRRIVKEADLVQRLEERSYGFEKKVIAAARKPHKVNVAISDVSIENNKNRLNNLELFNYVYDEKEYYINHKMGGLVLHNIMFVLGTIGYVTAAFLFIVLG